MVRNQSPKLLSSSRLETVSGGGLGSLFNTTIIISTMMSTTMMRGMMMRMMGMGTTITG
jgi:hypothetical protein